MHEFSSILAVYTPIYVYVTCALYTIVLVNSLLSTSVAPNLISFHQTNKTPMVRVLFILTLMALLGTPPTIGFFGKLLTFYLLAKKLSFTLLAATLLTLILIVFYLQTIRMAGALKKKTLQGGRKHPKISPLYLIFGQYVMALPIITVPYTLDILYSLFI